MKLIMVALLVVGSRAVPVDNVVTSPSSSLSVDLKKPAEASKNMDTKPLSSNMATPLPDMKLGNGVEEAPASDANKADLDKRFLLPGYGHGIGFGGYRGLHGTHGTFANFPSVGSYADHVRGYGGYDVGGVGGALPASIGLPGGYFG